MTGLSETILWKLAAHINDSRTPRVGLAAAKLLAGEAKVEVRCVALVCKVWPTLQVPGVSSSPTTMWRPVERDGYSSEFLVSIFVWVSLQFCSDLNRLVGHDRSFYFDFDCLSLMLICCSGLRSELYQIRRTRNQPRMPSGWQSIPTLANTAGVDQMAIHLVGQIFLDVSVDPSS